jgi:hypothetical protein
MGGWKQKEESSLLVPSTFLFLYQPSVCLCVSRVRAYLTTNQHLCIYIFGNNKYCTRKEYSMSTNSDTLAMYGIVTPAGSDT